MEVRERIKIKIGKMKHNVVRMSERTKERERISK